ncbi:MAG: cellulase family glycosylhydrolase [Chitinophagales bacterium]
MRKIYILPIVLTLFIFSCKKDNERKAFVSTEDPTIIQDEYGRQLILHGLNTSSSAKSDTQRLPWIIESDVDREDKEFGFNFVRYLILWDAIEPQKGVFDETYLDKVEERVNWYTSRGMHVMLDMHQDLYSIVFGGDGAPAWACRTNGAAPLEIPGGTPWWLKNIDPAVINSWINFWTYSGSNKDLQEHYILMWQKVAERFKNNPNVIGYDLMNEPWGGDLIKVFVTGEFERYQLSAFYKRLIPALRSVEPNKYLFFEPTPAPVTFGMPSNLSKISDTRSSAKIVYAPHCYPYDTHEGQGYTATSKSQLKDWERERVKEIKLHGNAPLLTGEFGLSPHQAGFADYLTDFNAMSDRNLWHWAYWSNDKGGWSPLNGDRTETAILPHLIRTYPKATAGKLESFSFDVNTKIFTMTFTSNTTISKPTEIFIPNRFYPNGWDLSVAGTTKYTSTTDAIKQTLLFSTTDNDKEITLTITPK